jgi:cytosine/adenosine deaminase-related metal-dependent hydrolase
MGSILIRGGTIVTMDPARPVLEDGWLAIEGRHIAALGAGPPPARPGAVTIEAAGKIVMPGLINAHLHTRPGRAMGDVLKPEQCMKMTLGNFFATFRVGSMCPKEVVKIRL